MSERLHDHVNQVSGEPASDVFVCMSVDCKSRGSAALMQGLTSRLAGAGVAVRPYLCFSACNIGPNVVVPDKRCWYSGVATSDLDAVAAYIEGGADVPRLRQQNDPELEDMIFSIIEAGLIPT
jgi:(2Fe-2S) ferredoxin